MRGISTTLRCTAMLNMSARTATKRPAHLASPDLREASSKQSFVEAEIYMIGREASCFAMRARNSAGPFACGKQPPPCEPKKRSLTLVPNQKLDLGQSWRLLNIISINV